MAYVEKLVMKGFKSFATETELPMENGMNVIVGPNGSGKSNITDAICFVLGRLSVKSMRASKSSNLIFSGSKVHKPAPEASVKITFNNDDKNFSIDKRSIEVQRIVRRNGQGIYRINGETKTRNEVLELLAQAGIDPHGFNIVLQGEIADIIRMNPLERRKVVEEVAGISVYESRKERSLRELEKTDEKLKEINAILRERTAYLKNLETERQQALKFKKLEENQKKYKASIISKNIEIKDREVRRVNEEIEKNIKARDKLKEKLAKISEGIGQKEAEINEINQYTQRTSGVEMEELHNQISNLRAEIAGLTVKKDNNEMRLDEVKRRKTRSEEQLKTFDKDVEELKKKSPEVTEKLKELERKKAELAGIEAKRKRFYTLKNEMESVKERIKDKASQMQRNKNETEFSLKEIEKLAANLSSADIDECRQRIANLQKEVETKQKELFICENERFEMEKSFAVRESEIYANKKIKEQVSKLDICPLCKTKITEGHIGEVYSECDGKIEEAQKSIDKNKAEVEERRGRATRLREEINNHKTASENARIELVTIANINEKKDRIKRFFGEEKVLAKDYEELTSKLKHLEHDHKIIDNVDEIYERLLHEIEDISSRTEDNLDLEIKYKQRELEKVRDIIKQAVKDEADLAHEISELIKTITQKTKELEENDKKEHVLQEKFKKLFDRRDELQGMIQKESRETLEVRHESDKYEMLTNNLKIDKAKYDAEIESYAFELKEYGEIEIIKASINELQEKLTKTIEELSMIGTVNLRALEVYESVRVQYEEVAGKAETLLKEKEEIMNIIIEIDKKKKKTFNKTFEAMNEIFRRNFLQLSSKGEAYLELENTEDPFAGGVNIVIKIARGKYFDVSSLSGGEKTMVALSLIFAIQEYKPYSFYIFDEVDAALDKRNSEKLAALVKKHMKSGQYIIVTHNDALITESTTLYGISMQDGVSKILSLKI
jgi:chromosome segregation protein